MVRVEVVTLRDINRRRGVVTETSVAPLDESGPIWDACDEWASRAAAYGAETIEYSVTWEDDAKMSGSFAPEGMRFSEHLRHWLRYAPTGDADGWPVERYEWPPVSPLTTATA